MLGRLAEDVPDDVRVLTTEDIVALVALLVAGDVADLVLIEHVPVDAGDDATAEEMLRIAPGCEWRSDALVRYCERWRRCARKPPACRS